MAYDPNEPMKDRITDIGPPHYEQYFPPVMNEETFYAVQGRVQGRSGSKGRCPRYTGRAGTAGSCGKRAAM